MSKLLRWLATLAAIPTALALCAIAWHLHRQHAAPELTAPFHAVALANGQVFFGRLDPVRGDYAVLRDVYYIQSRQDPQTRQVANVLVKRGGEAHGPDRMIVNRQQVLLIEPVTAESNIARLIAEQAAAR